MLVIKFQYKFELLTLNHIICIITFMRFSVCNFVYFFLVIKNEIPKWLMSVPKIKFGQSRDYCYFHVLFDVFP